MNVLIYGIVIWSRYFKTAVVYLTEVRTRQLRRTQTANGRNSIAVHKDIGTVFDKVVKRKVEVAESSDVDTIVLLPGCFPLDFVVTKKYFTYGLSVCCYRRRNEKLSEMIRVVHGITCTKCKLRNIVQIQEAVRAKHVVTNFTKRSTEFKFCQQAAFIKRSHKLLAWCNPADRERREETKAVFRSKLLGTVITEVELGKVTRVVVIGETTGKAYHLERYGT